MDFDLTLQEFPVISGSFMDPGQTTAIFVIFMDNWSKTVICAHMNYRLHTYLENDALDLCARSYLASLRRK